jgi:hypothetical protein
MCLPMSDIGLAIAGYNPASRIVDCFFLAGGRPLLTIGKAALEKIRHVQTVHSVKNILDV